MDPAGTGYSNLAGDDFPRDIMMVDSWSGLVNETGGKAMLEDGVYNHHIVFMDVSKKAAQPWLSCSGKAVPEMPGGFFMGAGSEDVGKNYNYGNDAKVKAGYYIGKNDIITLGMDIVNYRNEEKTLYMVNEMEFLPGKPEGYVHAQSRIIPMGLCDGPAGFLTATNVHPPKGQSKFVLEGKNDMTVMQDGHLLNTCK
jgi:hypothetical protein